MESGRARHQPHQYAEGTANRAGESIRRKQGCVTFTRDLSKSVASFLSGRIRLKPMSGLEVRGRRRTSRSVRFRRLVIRRSRGMPRRYASGCTAKCPATLQEAKPKAGSTCGHGGHTSDRSRESKPRSRSRVVVRTVAWNAIIPTKINRERTDGQERHVGPVGQKCR
jgi:hypothetical protein